MAETTKNGTETTNEEELQYLDSLLTKKIRAAEWAIDHTFSLSALSDDDYFTFVSTF